MITLCFHFREYSVQTEADPKVCEGCKTLKTQNRVLCNKITRVRECNRKHRIMIKKLKTGTVCVKFSYVYKRAVYKTQHVPIIITYNIGKMIDNYFLVFRGGF